MTAVPLPIRISVRVTFDDGTEHNYEVRTPDAVPAPGGFWPEGVVTADVAQRIEYDRRQRERWAAVRAVLTRSLTEDPDGLGVLERPRDDSAMLDRALRLINDLLGVVA